MTRIGLPSGTTNQILAVEGGNSDLPPTLGYKIFFDAVCDSARDYSQVFTKPSTTFIGTTDYAHWDEDGAYDFIGALASGGGPDAIVNLLNNYENVYAYKSY